MMALFYLNGALDVGFFHAIEHKQKQAVAYN